MKRACALLLLLLNMTLNLTAADSSSTASAPAVPDDVRFVTLGNGLQIIIREDRSAPVVSAQAWCRAGSINEGAWLGAGLSHVLEHMLFKGTSNRAPGVIDQQVQDAGGYMNAYTSFDRTVYHIDVPNTGAKIAVDILCDIMMNATLPADELGKEMDVIRREMDMNQDDPRQKSGRRLFEVAYTRSPYRFTVIGYPDIFNDLKRDDIFNYYRDKYAPNNLFFVVVGDIKAQEVEEQIRAAFATSKARPMPSAPLEDEPPQMAPREIIEEGTVELAHMHLSWHIPDVRHPDMPLLDVLATLLGNGRSSRLYQQVREKQGLVNSVDAWTYTPGGAGLFGMSAMMEADKFEAAREAILAELEKMKRKPVTQEELTKAVKMFTAGTLSSRKTMAGQAADLGGSWMAANDLNFSRRYLEIVKRATPADLQRVARTYLTEANRTLYALLPTGTKPKAKLETQLVQTNAIQKFELANGLRLLVKEDHRLPFVEIRTAFRGGVLSETTTNNGVTALMAKMLLQGTKARSAEQIASEMESMGGTIDSYGGNNSFGVNAEVLSNDFTAGLNVVADVLLHSTFPKEAFEREREMQLSAIRAQRDQLLQSGGRQMRRALFGDKGYGLDANGTEESVGQLTAADAKKHYAGLFAPTNCVIAIFGDVKTADVKKAITQRFGAWTNRALIPELSAPPALDGIQRVTDTRDKKQAVLLIGYPGTTIFSEDRYALELLQEALSDLGSRLFTRIREKLGLAYYVGAQNFLGLSPGYFAFYTGTEPEKVKLVETEMLKEAAALRTDGLTAEELKRAKAKVIGQKKIARQDLGGYAMAAALDELYGLGYDRSDKDDAKYEAVTLADIKRVTKKVLAEDKFVISVVQPGK
jgi:zinc protease